MQAINNTQIFLRARPQEMMQLADFQQVTTLVPDLTDGQFLVKIAYISLDPALRGWMNEGTTYIAGVALGSVMRAFAAGYVIASKNADFKQGDAVTGLFGAQEYAVSNGQGVEKVDAKP